MNDEPTPSTAASFPDGAAPPTAGLSARRAVGIFAAFLGVQLLVMGPPAFWAGLHAAPDSDIDLTLAILSGLAGTACAGYVALRMARRALPGAMALIGWVPASAHVCGVAALQGMALALVLPVAHAYLPLPAPGSGPLGPIDELSFWLGVAGIVFAAVVAPLAEELLFRGVLYTGLARRWRPPIAGTLTTLAFLAMHVPQLGGHWPGWILIGLLGALALRARVATGSLLPAIALHSTYNLGIVLAATVR